MWHRVKLKKKTFIEGWRPTLCSDTWMWADERRGLKWRSSTISHTRGDAGGADASNQNKVVKILPLRWWLHAGKDNIWKNPALVKGGVTLGHKLLGDQLTQNGWKVAQNKLVNFLLQPQWTIFFFFATERSINQVIHFWIDRVFVSHGLLLCARLAKLHSWSCTLFSFTRAASLHVYYLLEYTIWNENGHILAIFLITNIYLKLILRPWMIFVWQLESFCQNTTLETCCRCSWWLCDRSKYKFLTFWCQMARLCIFVSHMRKLRNVSNSQISWRQPYGFHLPTSCSPVRYHRVPL